MIRLPVRFALLLLLTPLLGCSALRQMGNKHKPNENQVTALYALPLAQVRDHFYAAFDAVGLEVLPSTADTLHAQTTDPRHPTQVRVALHPTPQNDGPPVVQATISSTYVMRSPTFTHVPIELLRAVSEELGQSPYNLRHVVPETGLPTAAGCRLTTPIGVDAEGTSVWSDSLDVQPRLPGGLRQVQQQVRYTSQAREAGTEGQVFIQFIVDKFGVVNCAEIISGLPNGLNEVSLRALTGQRFEPGQRRGQPVDVLLSLPITYWMR